MESKVIVIGNHHHNTLGVLRSLGEKGLKSELIVTNDSYKFITYSKYINSVHVINGNEEIVDLLLSKFKNKENSPIIICCNDNSIAELDKHYEVLSRYFVVPNAGHQGRINCLMSKSEQQFLASKAGLRCPNTWRVRGSMSLPNEVVFPCIVKTDSSIDGGKTDIKVCQTFDELKRNTTRDVDYIIQEYVEKEYELNVVACSLNHGENIIIPGVIHKLREYPSKKGSSSFAVLKDCTDYPHLQIDAIRRMMALTRYEGLFSIEFVCKNNQCYFLEVNFRNDGNGYIPTSAGLNLPYLWCCHKLNYEIGENEINTPHYFMADVRDIMHVIKEKDLTFTKWFRDLKRTNCFLLYNSKDRRPFWNYLRVMLIAMCHSLLRAK